MKKAIYPLLSLAGLSVVFMTGCTSQYYEVPVVEKKVEYVYPDTRVVPVVPVRSETIIAPAPVVTEAITTATVVPAVPATSVVTETVRRSAAVPVVTETVMTRPGVVTEAIVPVSPVRTEVIKETVVPVKNETITTVKEFSTL